MGETQNSANRQKDIERILKLRLLDDIFMKEVLKDNLPGVQDIIQVILKRDDISNCNLINATIIVENFDAI